jgi:hypothetical protein
VRSVEKINNESTKEGRGHIKGALWTMERVGFIQRSDFGN